MTSPATAASSPGQADDQEDRPPPQRVGDRTAQHVPQRRPDRQGQVVDSHRPAALLDREEVGDQERGAITP